VKLPVPPVLVITDRHQAKRPLEAIAAAVFAGGGRWLSLREKDLPPDERVALLRRLVLLGRPYGATVTVHDDIEAALAAGAAGVHLPDSGDVREARARLGGAALIGISSHNLEAAKLASEAGADYASLSPIWRWVGSTSQTPPLAWFSAHQQLQ
jgi:thiamine-phosphate pyrophosphorylase